MGLIRLFVFDWPGRSISTDGSADTDVKSRINKARHRYDTLCRVWQFSHISKKHKIRIFNTSVKSVLLHVSETWKVTNSISKRLQVFLNKCLRRIDQKIFAKRLMDDALMYAQLGQLSLSSSISLGIENVAGPFHPTILHYDSTNSTSSMPSSRRTPSPVIKTEFSLP